MRKANGRAMSAFTKAVTGRDRRTGSATGFSKMNQPVPIIKGEADRPNSPIASTLPRAFVAIHADNGLAGLTLDFAAAVYDPTFPTLKMLSDPAPFTIAP